MEKEILTKEQYIKLYSDLYNHDGFKMFLDSCLTVIQSINKTLMSDRTIIDTERNFLFGLKSSLQGIVDSFEQAEKEHKKSKDVKNS